VTDKPIERILLSLLLVAVTGATPLSARVTLLVGEPFGRFGFFNPTGHAAVYLSGMCAEAPTVLRRCHPGETGVVISRYHRIAGYDWIAVPLLAYLYAVDEPEDVPASADALAVAQLRASYRHSHLRELAPDAPGGEVPKGDWIQLVGAAYDRSIYGFGLETTPEDDDRLIGHLNSQRNKQRFHLLYRNCADFARDIINFYYPRAVRRSFIADGGISTPKHAGKALVSYARQRPGLHFVSFMIPQVAGRPRSSRMRGVSESLVLSKKYVAPLLFLQPWVVGAAAAAYLTSGRFNAARQPHAVCDPNALAVCLTSADFAAHLPGERVADLSDATNAPERRSEIEVSHLNRSTAEGPPDVQMSPLVGAEHRAANRGDLP